jgi:HEPN domain-containing protein
MQPNEIEYKEWLNKAEEDLASAKILLKNKIFSTALYHSQQCAEKTLKSILVKFNQPVPKSHDLAFLSKLTIPLVPQCQIFIEKAIFMTSYSWKYRYPGEQDEPDFSDTEEAIDVAEDIFVEIKNELFKK